MCLILGRLNACLKLHFITQEIQTVGPDLNVQTSSVKITVGRLVLTQRYTLIIQYSFTIPEIVGKYGG